MSMYFVYYYYYYMVKETTNTKTVSKSIRATSPAVFPRTTYLFC